MGLRDLAVCLEGLVVGDKGGGLVFESSTSKTFRLFIFLGINQGDCYWLRLPCFPFSPIHVLLKRLEALFPACLVPPVPQALLWRLLLSKRLQGFPFLLLKHEGFPLQVQLLKNRLFWKPASCRLKYLYFCKHCLCLCVLKSWARVSAAQRVTAGACEQKLHFCSLAAGVQSRVYIFIFSQP